MIYSEPKRSHWTWSCGLGWAEEFHAVISFPSTDAFMVCLCYVQYYCWWFNHSLIPKFQAFMIMFLGFGDTMGLHISVFFYGLLLHFFDYYWRLIHLICYLHVSSVIRLLITTPTHTPNSVFELKMLTYWLKKGSFLCISSLVLNLKMLFLIISLIVPLESKLRFAAIQFFSLCFVRMVSEILDLIVHFWMKLLEVIKDFC